MTNGIIDSGQEIVTNGLVLHLDAAQRRSYSGTGTTWTDLSGNSNNGTLTNGPTFNSANGGSMQVDGTDDYSLVSNKFITGFTAFTFEMWVYATDNLGGTLCCYNVPTVHSGPQFSFAPNSIGLTFYSGNGSNFIYNYSTTLSNKINTWYHVVGTWTTAGIKLYLNGVDVSGSNVTLGSPPTSVPGDVQGQIVAFRIAAGLTNQDSYFKGLISNVKVYNRALSGTEVLQNYNATKSRFEVPALLDLYPNAAAAYSLRKLRSGYTGSAIRVRRSSDNTEQDIGFTSTGDLDTTALTTFVGANNGFVSTWYDQSGNNRNATQTTQANQPSIVTAGEVLTRYNKPNIVLSGTSLNVGTQVALDNNNSLFSVLNSTSTGSLNTGIINYTTNPVDDPEIIIGQVGNSNFYINGGYIWSNLNTSALSSSLISQTLTNGSTAAIYRNSTQLAAGTRSGSVTATAGELSIGAYNRVSGTRNGNISELIIYNSDQSLNRIGIETNINSYYGIYNPTVVTMDTDAQAFITAAGITDLVQQGAINTLVQNLKTANIWPKMKAIYPFVGGTANSHKFNLKDPRDVDGAFRLVFFNTWTHNSNGVQGNGTNAYANTYATPLLNLSLNSTHISTYVRNNVVTGGDIGCSDSSLANGLYINPRFTGDTEFSRNNSGAPTPAGVSNTNSVGFWLNSRINSSTFRLYRNDTIWQVRTSNSTGLSNNVIYLGSLNLAGSIEYSSRQIAFATIGDGLTDTEAANLYSAVQTFQTTLGRQV